MTPKRTIRYYFLKFRRLQGDPISIARGTAIGIFLGIVPIAPFHTISNIAITIITKTSTVAAMLASILVCNPLTYVPQYYFSMIIGNAVTPYNFSWDRIKNTLDILQSKPGLTESIRVLCDLGSEAVIILLVGGTILALPFTVVSYFLSVRFFTKLQEKKRQKHILY